MLILALESSAKPASVAVCEVLQSAVGKQSLSKHSYAHMSRPAPNERTPPSAVTLSECSESDCLPTTHSDVKLLGQYFQNNGFSHSRTLMAMTKSLLKNLALNISDINLIAVASGPGSFTGVRIGVSAAKGIAWGADIKVCGVSTPEAMASQAFFPETIICPVMDARRGQVYNALFRWSGGTLERLCEDRAISLEKLADDLHSRILEHDEIQRSTTPVTLIGDGASLSNEFLSEKGIICSVPPELMRYQTAYGVAIAAVSGQQLSAAELEPSYIRPSQAERERSQSSNN